MSITTGTSDLLAKEEQAMMSVVKRLQDTEQRCRNQAILIDRLRDLIRECHDDCFPPETKVESEKRYS